MSGLSRRARPLVDRLGDELLADAGLAEDQHGHRRVGDALDERVHAAHRRIEHDRLVRRRRRRRGRRGALPLRSAGAQLADQRLDGRCRPRGTARVAARRVDAGRAREVEHALDRGRGPRRGRARAGSRGSRRRRPRRSGPSAAASARSRRSPASLAMRTSADRERPVIAHRAIDLGGQPRLAGGVVGDRARAAQPARRRRRPRGSARSRSRRRSRAGATPSILSPLTRVPLREPRSSTSIASPVRRMRACMRETFSLSTWTVAPRERPNVTSTPSGSSMHARAASPSSMWIDEERVGAGWRRQRGAGVLRQWLGCHRLVRIVHTRQLACTWLPHDFNKLTFATRGPFIADSPSCRHWSAPR